MLDPTAFGSVSDLLIMRLSNLSQNVTSASPLVQRLSLPSFSSSLLLLSFFFFFLKSISYQLKFGPLTVAEENSHKEPSFMLFLHALLYSICTMGFPSGSAVKDLPATAGRARDLGSIPRSGKSPGGVNGNPLQYSCLKNPMDRWNSNTLATSCEELTHWERPWCWEGLGAGGAGDDRGRDRSMVSPTWWAWVWVNSGSWWWIGRPGVLRFMGSQRVGHDWATELKQPTNKDGTVSPWLRPHTVTNKVSFFLCSIL